MHHFRPARHWSTVRARLTAAALAALLLASCGSSGGGSDGAAVLDRGPDPTASGLATTAPKATAPPTPSTTDPPVEAPPLPLGGCPPPPAPPSTGTPTPAFVPPHLVPDAELPAALAPPGWTPDLKPLDGKGMWIWQYGKTEGGDYDAMVKRAADAGLRQLWVRVGDSQDRFYAKRYLDALVPKAHKAGIAVIGWGFPYLFDPADDAAWAADALAWRSPGGDSLDGFSPDLELDSEGVMLSEARTRVYLGLVRKAAGARLVVATVYRPSDRLWPSAYPYAAMAPYVDAFAPMDYWNCLEPGGVAQESIDRLKTLKPVHTIGMAYDASGTYRRMGAPNGAEIRRFLDASRRDGARGSSFWVWQLANDDQWSALAAYSWR